MQAAGYRGPDMFSNAAYRKIAKASRGLVRRVNVLGDKALLATYAANAYQVSGKEVTTAIADSEFGRIDLIQSAGLALIPDISVGDFSRRTFHFNFDIIVTHQRDQLFGEIVAIKIWLRDRSGIGSRF